MTAQNVIKLGAREYTLVPQPIAVVLRKLPLLAQGTQDLGEMGVEGISSMEVLVGLLGDKVYDALRLFIPELAPNHELLGFSTRAAMDADEFDEEFAKQHSPTSPQIFQAFDVAMLVNGGTRLKDVLGNVLGPELIKAMRSFVVAQLRVRLSQMSQNLPEPNGVSPSTSSGTSAPTPLRQESEASPALVSSPS
jgi:hypothetical protein